MQTVTRACTKNVNLFPSQFFSFIQLFTLPKQCTGMLARTPFKQVYAGNLTAQACTARAL